MTSGSCSRCGRVTELEYGPDGLGYCTSCAFYGMNKQCWRCRMYLPAAELQQYRGQLTCPYCIQDLRYADTRTEFTEEKHKLEVIQYPEQCERCGRDLEGRVYIWNGRKLCKKCMEDEQDSKWGLVGGGPMHAPQRMSLRPEAERKKKSLIEHVFSELLIFLRLKKRPVTEVVIYGGKMPIQRAKPMAEKPMEAKPLKQERKPEAEGIIKSGAKGEYEGHGEPFEFEGEGAPSKPAAGPQASPPQEKKAKKKARRNRKKGKRSEPGLGTLTPVRTDAA